MSNPEIHIQAAIEALSLPLVPPATDNFEVGQDGIANENAISRIQKSLKELNQGADTTLLIEALAARLTPHLGVSTPKIGTSRVEALVRQLDTDRISIVNQGEGTEMVSLVIHPQDKDGVTTQYTFEAGRIKTINSQQRLSSVETRYVYDKDGMPVKSYLEAGSPVSGSKHSVELMLGYEDGVLSKPLCRRTDRPANTVLYLRIGSINPLEKDLEAELQRIDVPVGFSNAKYAEIIVSDIYAGSSKNFVEYEPETL